MDEVAGKTELSLSAACSIRYKQLKLPLIDKISKFRFKIKKKSRGNNF